MSERDTQRSKLYKAERAVEWGEKLPSVADIERFLRKLDRATLRRRYGSAVEHPIRVSDGRGRRRAYAYGTIKIAIPLWARSELIVLHEAAHCIHDRLRSFRFSGGTRRAELRDGPSHGWQYAAIYLDLVRFVMGPEAGAALQAAFKAHRVRFRPKRQVSEAQREAVRERFRKAA